MSITGTVKMCGLWLVLLLRASDDFSTVVMTLKERGTSRKTVINRMVVTKKLHEHEQKEDKLKGIKAQVEELLKEEGKQLVAEGEGSCVPDWEDKLKELLHNHIEEKE